MASAGFNSANIGFNDPGVSFNAATRPVLQSVTIRGDTLTLTYDENLEPADPSAGINVNASGGA